MDSEAITPEPRWPLGDCASLLEYRRTATSMQSIYPLRPIGAVGHTYAYCGWRVSPGPGGQEGVLIASDITKQILHPDDAVAVFPDIATGGRCGTCYSTDRAVVIGPICPDDWHDGPHETHWRRIAIQTTALIVAAVWLLALFLLTIGVI